MQMVAFRVQHYRSIIDSGWVDAGETTVVVGKNESGKTSLLKALWKFNPYHEEAYDLQREWPRGQRKLMSDEETVVTVRYRFNEDECAKLAAIGPLLAETTGVEIARTYAGTYTYTFLPEHPTVEANPGFISTVIKKHFGNTTLLALENVRAGYRGFVDAITNANRIEPGAHPRAEVMATAPRAGETPYRRFSDAATTTLQGPMVQAIQDVYVQNPVRQAVEMVHGWLPTFIYMDDYKVFTGSAQLNQLAQRQETGKLTDEDRTVLLILEMAGLRLDDEMRKVTLPDKEQRMLDLHDAGHTLTEEIAHRWTQKKYEVRFQADGYHFITFVKDAATDILVPLEERSKGFQWFFSFDMTFMYETRGEFRNAIILLDEPGLHLHAAAQRDLLARIAAYARTNQLLYTTHLPFMIDYSRLDAIYIAEDLEGVGTKIRRPWETSDPDARFTVQAAFGLSWAQSLFAEQGTLVVEGMADYWLLSLASTLLQEAGDAGLRADITITPAGSASIMAYVGSLLHDQRLDFVMLLRDIPQDDSPYARVIQSWIEGRQHLLLLSAILGRAPGCTTEDLFPAADYIRAVEQVYATRLSGAPLTLAGDETQPILARVTTALAARGVADFHRDRVARRVMGELSARGTLTPSTQEAVTRVVAAINAAFTADDGVKLMPQLADT